MIAEQLDGTAGALLGGRESEERAFAACLRRLGPESPGQRIAVHGEPGLGKTRLLEAFRAQGVRLGVGWISASVSEADRNVPYRVWRSLLAGLLAGLAARWHQTVSQTVEPRAEARVLRAMLEQGDDAPRRRELLPVMGDLLVTGFPETERSAALAPEGRAEALAELVSHLVARAAGESGIVIAIDDAQWLDSASLRLLERVLGQCRGLIVVLGLQTLNRLSERMMGDIGTINLVLRPLSERELSGVLRATLSGVEPSDELRAAIAHESAGFPLHAIELVRLLLDRGQIVTRHGRASLGDAGSLQAAAGLRRARDVRALLAARVQRLQGVERPILEVGAVAPGPFTAQWVQLVGKLDEPSLRAGLALAVERALIEPVQGSATYRFRHGYLRQAAIDSVDPARLRALHAAAAAVAESGAHAGAEVVAARIAAHWRQAGDAWRAVEWLRRAGLEAMQRYAHEEAVAHFGEALELLDASAPSAVADPAHAAARVECLRRNGYTLLQLGDLAGARACLLGALQIGGARVPDTPGGYAWRVAGDLLALIVRPLVGRVRRNRASSENRDLSVALIRLGHVAYLQADAPLLAYASLHCLRVVGRSAPDRESAIIEGWMATGLGAVGLHRMASRFSERSMATATRIGDPATLSQAFEFAAMYRANTGQWPLGVRYALQAYRVARRTGDGRRASECALVLGFLRARAQARPAARRWYVAVCRIALDRRDAQALAWGRLGLAREALASGDEGEALRLLEQVADPAPDRLSDIERVGLRSAALRAAGQAGAVEEAVRSLRWLGTHRPVTFSVLPGARAAMETLLADAHANRSGEALTRARWAVGCFSRFALGVPVARPAMLIGRGALARLAGREGRARTLWARAARVAESMQLRDDRALALGLIAGGPSDPAR